MERNGRSKSPTDQRRQRSVQYPGVPLPEAIAFCASIEARGLDGLPADQIAAGLGFGNRRTNRYSAALSAAKQFGLLQRVPHAGYALTDLASGLIDPKNEPSRTELRRQAFQRPPLYAILTARFAGKRLPDATTLASILERSEHITASAKDTAASAFLASARFAGLLGSDEILHADGEPTRAGPASGKKASSSHDRPVLRRGPGRDVRIDMRLWGDDEGKVVRVRAPDSMTAESFERLVEALRLMLRIEPSGNASSPG